MKSISQNRSSDEDDWIEVIIQDGEEQPAIDFDPDDDEADLAVCRAPADADEAAKALLIAARYLRENKPLPWILRSYLAGAIEASMLKPNGDSRNTAFLRELHLAAENRRPVKALWFEVGDLVEMEMRKNGGKLNAAFDQAAKKFSISKSSASRLYKTCLEKRTEMEEIEKQSQEPQQ
ncbi:hypothetical protein [Pseudomonas sp. JG-B]|uniref:hypothetical protein n=1 Tax=Pseudomonas sp. JG-B TaxID=2603214 RepID=UPI00129E7DE4|nr:hypothetical protein [Pseudomonas sp. JG-B]MRK20720.1 hypothetical protein [Pseudomonas sp. JG-B]